MSEQILARLAAERDRLIHDWRESGPINHFVLDDVMPESWVREVRAAFPKEQEMVLRSSLRELKYVAAQMNRYNPLLEECIYAFQAPAIVQEVQAITGLRELEPDELLYAGGVSMMGPGHFLNPHVDNSHDKMRQRYRVLNLLFYASPDWTEANGCNLELWPRGPKAEPTTIVSRFNRLVVMLTGEGSWHSVSTNRSTDQRCCVSNYYFSRYPAANAEYFHVTSFRGRPEQKFRDAVLRADSWLRMAVRRVFPSGVRQTKHFYDKTSARLPK